MLTYTTLLSWLSSREASPLTAQYMYTVPPTFTAGIRWAVVPSSLSSFSKTNKRRFACT